MSEQKTGSLTRYWLLSSCTFSTSTITANHSYKSSDDGGGGGDDGDADNGEFDLLSGEAPVKAATLLSAECNGREHENDAKVVNGPDGILVGFGAI